MSKKMYMKMYRPTDLDEVLFDTQDKAKVYIDDYKNSEKDICIPGYMPKSKDSVVEEVIVLVKVLHVGLIGSTEHE